MLYKINDNKKGSKNLEERFEKWKAFNANSFENLQSNADKSNISLFTVFASAIVSGAWPELNEDAINEAITDFSDNYADSDSNRSFYDKLVVNWNNFCHEVTALNTDQQGEPITALNDLAIRLIHRYDTNTNRWFLTAQLCVIGTQSMATTQPEIYNVYSLTPLASYFHINLDGTLGKYTAGDLTGTDSSQYSQDYFDNVLYNGDALQLGTNTQNVTLAWNEFVQLYNNNFTPGQDPTLFAITFASSSFDCTDSDDSPVEYPHCVLAYMTYNGNPCLDDGGYVVGSFYNKAGDFNTLCPQRCNTLLYPIGHFLGR